MIQTYSLVGMLLILAVVTKIGADDPPTDCCCGPNATGHPNYCGDGYPYCFRCVARDTYGAPGSGTAYSFTYGSVTLTDDYGSYNDFAGHGPTGSCPGDCDSYCDNDDCKSCCHYCCGVTSPTNPGD